jgi:glycerol-3-phosphate cytidylyltransferase
MENIMKVGITFSTFDLLHAGHILMLEEAKQNCDYLIVGLQTNPTIDRPETKNKPAQTIVERQIQLAAVKFVDEVVVYETEKDLLDILTVYPINIRFVGQEYMNKDFTGKEYCLDHDIEIVYNTRKHRFSTTELRKRAALKKEDW